MKGILITNRYYLDEGMKYLAGRLIQSAKDRGVTLTHSVCPLVSSLSVRPMDADFVIFWDKDAVAARVIENMGIPTFNSSETIRICDSKTLTYLALCGLDCLIPTVFSPVCFPVSSNEDDELILEVEKLGYPLIIKESTGSLGMQVYLINNRAELIYKSRALRHTAHQYQKYVGDERGTDIRFYVAGGAVVGACKRINTTSFTSNLAMGGKIELYSPTEQEKELALEVAKRLNLSFGSVDFIKDNGKSYFVEANSNAYFKGIESLGVDVAGQYVDSIIKTVKNNASKN
ncbi:MAG: RimK family alpha-L-glutamate ligase [Clostridia bacterium]|nr:RimK family alpha-L-glutamate ligase [Clostridia bacterium]